MTWLLGLLLCTLLVHHAQGQCSDESTILAKHNSYRAAHGAPAMTWDPALAAQATAWSQHLAAAGCGLTHSGTGGENLYACQGCGGSTCAAAVDLWYAEKSNYVFNTPTPWTTNSPTFSSWGHFTQVVWMGSTTLGCGTATGPNCMVVTCRYSPAGNLIGDASFAANVLPPTGSVPRVVPPAPTPTPTPIPTPTPDPVPAPAPVLPPPSPSPSPLPWPPPPSPLPSPSPPAPPPCVDNSTICLTAPKLGWCDKPSPDNSAVLVRDVCQLSCKVCQPEPSPSPSPSPSPAPSPSLPSNWDSLLNRVLPTHHRKLLL